MKHVIVSLLMIVLAAVFPARASEPVPAGYIVEVVLAGDDGEKNATAVVRNNAELPAKLMMPLIANDEVFLRDPKSRITIETGNGETIKVGAERMRVKISGEIDTGDGTWSILTAIAAVFASDDEQAPENMVAKGRDLKVPMALRSGNLLLEGRRKLWLGWVGGEAPFTVSLMADGAESQLAGGLEGNAADLVLPEKLQERFGLVLRDARQQQVQMRFRFAGRMPDLPATTAERAKSVTRLLAVAAFLTREADGAWAVEAAQSLREANEPAADALLARIQAGWKAK